MSKLTFKSLLVLYRVSDLLVSGHFHASASSSGSPEAVVWQEKSFSGNMQYTLERVGDSTIVKGETVGAASVLFMDKEFDISSTPFLN